MCTLRIVRPLAIVGMAALLASNAMAQSKDAPKLVLSQESWDFGKVWHPESPTLTLVIRNEGTADLRISQVKTTCGCTVADPERDVIPPGESTSVRVKYDTRGKQHDVSSKVIVESNDPTRPRVEFPIKGHVRRAVTRTPLGGLVIRTADTSPGQIGRLRLENQTDQPMRLRIVRGGIDGVDLRVEEVTPGLTYDVVGKTTRRFEPGVQRSDLVLSTGLTREPTMTVALQLRIMAMVEPIPRAIYLTPNRDEITRRPVSFRYYGDKSDFRILSGSAEHGDFKAEVGPVGPPRGGMAKIKPTPKRIARMYLTLPKPSDIPDGMTIKFQTNDPENPEVEILVTSDKAAFQRAMYGTEVTHTRY